MNPQQSALEVNLDLWKEKRIFDVLPVPVAILNTNLTLVYGNKTFSQTFGVWENRKCWEVYHKTTEMCPHQSCARTFEKKVPIVSTGEGVTQTGQSIHYTKYSVPLPDLDGTVSHILEICIDNTSPEILRDEYHAFFDQMPCCITIIDKELRIINSNRAVRDIYGDREGQHCYQMLKGQDTVCSNCIARKAFLTKTPQHDKQVWTTPNGDLRVYQVTAVPVEDEKGHVSSIMEMGVDVTELLSLRHQQEMENLMLTEVMHNSLRGLIVIADNGDISMLNPALIRMLDLPAIGVDTPKELYALLPENVIQAIDSGVDSFAFHDLEVGTAGGETVIVNLQGSRLKRGNTSLGLLLGFFDLRETRRLHKAKVDAERMAAVGQTVSGLSHGVKNLVTALEGGMYMLSSGMQGGKAERIAQGMDMLDRNIQRMGGFIKSFLNFARGRAIKTKVANPAAVVQEVVDLFRVKARQLGIDMQLDIQPGVPDAPIDYESLHEALTNLVTNAIDACSENGDDRPCNIRVAFYEKNDVLTYEVTDTGCGMDEATQQKVFSNFFTTKGMNGTGLGLLMSKKLITDHGGSITLESEVNRGTTFRILLPRRNLPEPRQENEQ